MIIGAISLITSISSRFRYRFYSDGCTEIEVHFGEAGILLLAYINRRLAFQAHEPMALLSGGWMGISCLRTIDHLAAGAGFWNLGQKRQEKIRSQAEGGLRSCWFKERDRLLSKLSELRADHRWNNEVAPH